ncbi:MAG: lamin tail domain-containing protein, partial [Planctomycetota bacterium]
GLSVGSHTVEYKTITGWDTPINETVQINDGLTTTTSGTYIQQTGSLQVTISPLGAVTAGAKWRVDGGTWRNSDYTESGLTVGSHTVEYSTVSGWNKPADEIVQVNDGQTTTTTGTYTQQTGYLQVTISPPGAVTAGAQWRVDGGTWRNSDYTESGLTVGSHTVEYKTITGWDTPVNETVQINDGLTTTTSGTYIQQTGSLQVTISPPGAVTAGAKWRVDGGAWRDSDYTENGLTVGSHTVEYNTITGWDTPINETVQINDGLTTTTTGTYTQQTGYLQVTISPPGAVTAGAQWRVDGGAWRNSDYTESGLPVGSHTVEYSTVSGWNKPANEIVLINDGQTTTTTGTYTAQSGSLQVTIIPPGAVTAGAKWRVDGGAWRNSDYTESGLSVGSHTIEYNTVTGWDTPINETVQINDGLTTTASGTYVQQTGSLQVTISPAEAVTTGAKWRVDGGAWRDSGYTESGLTVGLHTVDFNEIVGWTKPANQIVQINDGLTTTTNGNYIQQTHALLKINEFMASNASALPLEQGELLDGHGNSSDWIEIYNPTDETVSLDGWYLTDSNDNRTKWQFPDGNQLDPGEFMIIFASQKTYAANPLNYPYLDPAGYYHTNFELNKGGDYLALVTPDSNIVVHEYTPEYPGQLTNVSYGLAQYATTLVSTGASATYHVPTIGDSGLGTDWTDPNYDDSSWDTGETGLGFGNVVPGLNVTYYKANTTVDSLTAMEAVISNPSMQTTVVTETASRPLH